MAKVWCTVDFSENESKGLDEWLVRYGLDPETTDDLNVEVDIDVKDLDDEEIAEEYERRFPDDEDVISRVYRLLGEGDVSAAMDELHREYRHHLRHPSHERRVADLLSRKV